jgi:hypothetical protein
MKVGADVFVGGDAGSYAPELALQYVEPGYDEMLVILGDVSLASVERYLESREQSGYWSLAAISSNDTSIDTAIDRIVACAGTVTYTDGVVDTCLLGFADGYARSGRITSSIVSNVSNVSIDPKFVYCGESVRFSGVIYSQLPMLYGDLSLYQHRWMQAFAQAAREVLRPYIRRKVDVSVIASDPKLNRLMARLNATYALSKDISGRVIMNVSVAPPGGVAKVNISVYS